MGWHLEPLYWHGITIPSLLEAATVRFPTSFIVCPREGPS